jgi:hypothetical protein
VDFNEPIVKLLFKKVGRSIDIIGFQKAQYEQQRAELKITIAKLRPIKRSRISRINPNQLFCTIKDIIATRRNSEEAGIITEFSIGAQRTKPLLVSLADYYQEWQL